MNDAERRVQELLRNGLGELEMPDRLPAIRKRAQRARLVSIAAVALVLVAGAFAGTSLLGSMDKPEIVDKVPRPALSPLTPVVSAQIRFEGAGAFDLDAGSGAIWVAAHGGREAFETRLLKIDPLRNRPQETGVDLGAFSVPGEVEVSGDTVWIDGDRLVSVDARNHEVLTNTIVPAPGLAVGHDSVWTTGARIDSSTGRVVAEFPDAGGDEVVAGADWVWVADGSSPARVSKIDPKTTSVTGTSSRGGFFVEDIATDGADAWVAWFSKNEGRGDGDMEITEISGTTDEPIGDVIRIPNTDVVSDMTFAAGRLWVAAKSIDGRASLYQVDPTSHTLIGDPLRLDGTLVRLTPFGNSLWVSDFDQNFITRIDLRPCEGHGCDSEETAEDPERRNDCPSGIEGEGLEKGEPRPPKPYFYPFNLWRTSVDGKCVTVMAGLQSKWDEKAAMERGIYRRGVVLFMDESKSFTTRDRYLFAPLPAPIRIVDERGSGMESELILQSLIDCSLVSFDLSLQDFAPIGAEYPCPADDAPGHDRPTRVIADCFKPRIRPEEMVFDCATADLTADNLQWAGWNVRAASARGRFRCYGSKCQWERRGTIRLSEPRYCEELGVFVFTEGRVTFDKPVDGRRSRRIYPGCGVDN